MRLCAFNSSPPIAAYMRRRTCPALVRVMACRLFGAKPLSEPMLTYCQLDSCEQISVKFESELYHFHSRKWIWNCRLPKWPPFCPMGELIRFWYCVVSHIMHYRWHKYKLSFGIHITRQLKHNDVNTSDTYCGEGNGITQPVMYKHS